MPEYRKLRIGDMSDNGQITIVDEDRLCYIVKSDSRGSVGLRTISKALLLEFVEYSLVLELVELQERLNLLKALLVQ